MSKNDNFVTQELLFQYEIFASHFYDINPEAKPTKEVAETLKEVCFGENLQSF